MKEYMMYNRTNHIRLRLEFFQARAPRWLRSRTGRHIGPLIGPSTNPQHQTQAKNQNTPVLHT